ncbi:MAG: class I SAM-dependent methyltransferase [bacterium]
MEQDIVKRFFSGTGTSYDRVVKLFTYGADLYWKSKILARVPPSKRLLDLACGTGIVTFKLAANHPGSQILGVDMMHEYLRQARRKQNSCRQNHIHFVCARAEQVQLNSEFDCIVSSYVPKYVPADELLHNVSSYLKEDGVLILHDFAYPGNFVPRKVWHLHMSLMRVVGPLLFPEWRTVFAELVDLVRTTPWIAEYCRALPGYGFEGVEVQRLTAGSAAIITARKAVNRG